MENNDVKMVLFLRQATDAKRKGVFSLLAKKVFENQGSVRQQFQDMSLTALIFEFNEFSNFFPCATENRQ